MLVTLFPFDFHIDEFIMCGRCRNEGMMDFTAPPKRKKKGIPVVISAHIPTEEEGRLATEMDGSQGQTLDMTSDSSVLNDESTVYTKVNVVDSLLSGDLVVEELHTNIHTKRKKKGRRPVVMSAYIATEEDERLAIKMDENQDQTLKVISGSSVLSDDSAFQTKTDVIDVLSSGGSAAEPLTNMSSSLSVHKIQDSVISATAVTIFDNNTIHHNGTDEPAENTTSTNTKNTVIVITNTVETSIEGDHVGSSGDENGAVGTTVLALRRKCVVVVLPTSIEDSTEHAKHLIGVLGRQYECTIHTVGTTHGELQAAGSSVEQVDRVYLTDAFALCCIGLDLQTVASIWHRYQEEVNKLIVINPVALSITQPVPTAASTPSPVNNVKKNLPLPPTPPLLKVWTGCFVTMSVLINVGLASPMLIAEYPLVCLALLAVEGIAVGVHSALRLAYHASLHFGKTIILLPTLTPAAKPPAQTGQTNQDDHDHSRRGQGWLSISSPLLRTEGSNAVNQLQAFMQSECNVSVTTGDSVSLQDQAYQFDDLLTWLQSIY